MKQDQEDFELTERQKRIGTVVGTVIALLLIFGCAYVADYPLPRLLKALGLAACLWGGSVMLAKFWRPKKRRKTGKEDGQELPDGYCNTDRIEDLTDAGLSASGQGDKKCISFTELKKIEEGEKLPPDRLTHIRNCPICQDIVKMIRPSPRGKNKQDT